MRTKAFLMLEADHVEHGPVMVNAGSVQQETRTFQDGKCCCVILLTYPPGSPTHEQAMQAWAARFPEAHRDDLRNVRNWTVETDTPPGRQA